MDDEIAELIREAGFFAIEEAALQANDQACTAPPASTTWSATCAASLSLTPTSGRLSRRSSWPVLAGA